MATKRDTMQCELRCVLTDNMRDAIIELGYDLIQSSSSLHGYSLYQSPEVFPIIEFINSMK